MEIKVWDLSKTYKATWMPALPDFLDSSKKTYVWGWETRDHEIAFINNDGTFDCTSGEKGISLDDVEQWKIDEYYEVLASE